jgi:hypothetical protein
MFKWCRQRTESDRLNASFNVNPAAAQTLTEKTMNATYEIRYQSLFNEGRALCFPCDAEGHVELDSLSDRARENYLYARAVVGREFGYPSVRPIATH